MSKYEILVDSDALIGFFLDRDLHHQSATDLFTKLRSQRTRWVTTNLVIAEVATVLSRASGQLLATQFLQHIMTLDRIPMIFVDEALFEAALATFTKQQRRGTSVTDCANVVVMQQFEIPKIFSFDKVYSKDFGLSMVA